MMLGPVEVGPTGVADGLVVSVTFVVGAPVLPVPLLGNIAEVGAVVTGGEKVVGGRVMLGVISPSVLLGQTEVVVVTTLVVAVSDSEQPPHEVAVPVTVDVSETVGVQTSAGRVKVPLLLPEPP
jgi:hypothetical protein